MKEKRRFEKSYLIVLGIISLFLVVGYSSYALFTVKKENKEAIRIVTGTLTGTLTSEDSAFQENKITVDANTKKEITITLTNNNDRTAKLNFYYLDNISEKVHINYYKDTPNLPPTKDGIVLEQGASESYHLRIYNLTSSNVAVEFRSDGGFSDRELMFSNNGRLVEGIVVEVEAPASNMIPVVYDGSKWVKTSYNQENWYDYDKQEWANAVTVTPGTRTGYQQAGNGTEVKMADILQMWVWIPRYSYTIKSENGQDYYGKKEEGRSDNPSQVLPGEIDIKFLDASEKDEYGSAQYTGSLPENWYTPPGFTFGGKELSGIWVGKFETGYSTGNGTGVGVSSMEAAYVDAEEPNRAIIKPNVYSWRAIRVSTLDLVSRRMIESGNVFGFAGAYDSHVVKKTEYALISYLTQSKYGKYGNPLYTGANKEVYFNSYSKYMTGCSSGLPSGDSAATCGNTYDVMIDRGEGKGYAGAGASSTGNIYGIYDLNGGSWEYTMGVLNKMSGNTGAYNSGYTGLLTDGSTYQGKAWPADKYYDNYTSNNPLMACNGNPCKGHALNEVILWYGDYSNLGYLSSPWLVCSGAHFSNTIAGVFSYNYSLGYTDSSISFRQVLTPLQ